MTSTIDLTFSPGGVSGLVVKRCTAAAACGEPQSCGRSAAARQQHHEDAAHQSAIACSSSYCLQTCTEACLQPLQQSHLLQLMRYRPAMRFQHLVLRDITPRTCCEWLPRAAMGEER